MLILFTPIKNISSFIPEGLNYVLGGYVMFSIFGFPIFHCAKYGSKLLIRNSILKIAEDGSIEYDKMKEVWKSNDNIIEHTIYKISRVEKVHRTKRFYIIYGDIDFQTIYRGKKLEQGKKKKISIPIAYDGMERIGKNAK